MFIPLCIFAHDQLLTLPSSPIIIIFSSIFSSASHSLPYLLSPLLSSAIAKQ